jgi:hypothetical protein
MSKFDLPDFMNDMVFHGMRSLFGPDVVDYNEAWYMYDDFRKYWNQRVPENGMSYGRGFTLYGRLPKLKIDRDDLEDKLTHHYFDKIVYGSITRDSRFLLGLSSLNYKQKDVIIIDGEDNQTFDTFYQLLATCYKREHSGESIYSHVKPINFCIPKELIVKSVPKKEKDYAYIIPGDKSTYIYTDEKSYFEDYKKSYFGVTGKKGGWDCLRHYEILMNGCIPFFTDLENCPSNIMTRFPKTLVLDTMDKIKKQNDLSFYEECVTLLLNWTREKLTTESVAKYVLGI